MLTADKTTTLNGVKVNEYLLTKHNPNKIAMPTVKMTTPIGITVHNTADLANVNDDAEQYTRATYNGNMKSVRVHFYVDDLGAWQNLPLDLSSWHAGDGTTGTGNAKTISIECIMGDKDAAHDQIAEDNCARLVAYLCHKYGWTTANVYTHNHWMGLPDKIVSGASKNCPVYILPHWSTFLKKVETYIKALQPAPATPAKPTTTTTTKKSNEEIAKEVIAGKWGNGDERKKKLQAAGYDYDAVQKIVTQLMSGSKTTTTAKTTTTVTTKPATVPTFKKGDAIKLSSSAKYTTGKSVPLWVRALTCYVLSVNKDGSVVFSIKKNGAVTGAVPAKYVTKK